MPMEPETPIVRMPDPIERERPAAALNGFLGLLITVVGFAVLFFGGLAMTDADQPVGVLLVGAGVLFGLLGLRGLITVAPGQAKVLQFFGRYAGTVRVPGLRWVNPLTSRQLVSTRIRNHESAALKVNDADGNPIEIAAVVVWKVEDTARAVFEVDSFVAFVQTQTDTAIRHIATTYPYDSHGGGAHDGSGPLSLRENADAITGQLSSEISARVESAECGSWSPGSPTWRTRRRSPGPCCSASRPAPWWPPGHASWTGRSGWSRWPWTGSPSGRSWSWTRNARPPW
jgi:hypothetical protein